MRGRPCTTLAEHVALRTHLQRLAGLLLLALLAACAHGPRGAQARSVLFVGNSQVYVGNLPAVFDALSAANGHAVRSAMIVEGGATLAGRVADGTVARALAEARYDVVVLQERGGDAICAFGPASCGESEAAVVALSGLARTHGAEPVLLGACQSVPQVSTALVRAEATAAKRAGASYAAVSDLLIDARRTRPEGAWMFTDGVHPGHDLILLDAILLYREVFGRLPGANGFAVDAPMYVPGSRFLPPDPTSRAADSAPPPPMGHRYDAHRVAAILAVVAASGHEARDRRANARNQRP